MLTTQQKELLRMIVEDKFSIGAFSGMIFNAQRESGQKTEDLVAQALQVRLDMRELLK